MKNEPIKAKADKSNDPWDLQTMKTIAGYLTDEGYRFSFIADECIELFIQGKNLTMRFLIYAHNRHLVVRVPAFLRNSDLRRPDLLLAIMSIMNDFFDIRFELSDDGQSLSASCNHIIEDGEITPKQFNQVMMVVAYLVDENYPKLMKILLAGNDVTTESANADPISEEQEPEESDEDEENPDDLDNYGFPGASKNDGPKIN